MSNREWIWNMRFAFGGVTHAVDVRENGFISLCGDKCSLQKGRTVEGEVNCKRCLYVIESRRQA